MSSTTPKALAIVTPRAAAFIARADKIDRRLGPIPGYDADIIAAEFRDAAAVITDLFSALKVASDALVGTLKARGYTPGSDVSVWAPEVQVELRSLMTARAAIARAETPR